MTDDAGQPIDPEWLRAINATTPSPKRRKRRC
jgi:hypothetical protein